MSQISTIAALSLAALITGCAATGSSHVSDSVIESTTDSQIADFSPTPPDGVVYIVYLEPKGDLPPELHLDGGGDASSLQYVGINRYAWKWAKQASWGGNGREILPNQGLLLVSRRIAHPSHDALSLVAMVQLSEYCVVDVLLTRTSRKRCVGERCGEQYVLDLRGMTYESSDVIGHNVGCFD